MVSKLNPVHPFSVVLVLNQMIFLGIQDSCAFKIDGHTQKGRYYTRASGIHSFSFYYYGGSNGLGLIFAVKVLGNKVKRHM